MTPLPDQPVRLLSVDGNRTVVSCADGHVLLLDRELKILAARKFDGIPAEMASDGKTLLVFSGEGLVTALALE